VKWLLLVALVIMLFIINGCATTFIDYTYTPTLGIEHCRAVVMAAGGSTVHIDMHPVTTNTPPSTISIGVISAPTAPASTTECADVHTDESPGFWQTLGAAVAGLWAFL
jgi:hypothetical protein